MGKLTRYNVFRASSVAIIVLLLTGGFLFIEPHLVNQNRAVMELGVRHNEYLVFSEIAPSPDGSYRNQIAKFGMNIGTYVNIDGAREKVVFNLAYSLQITTHQYDRSNGELIAITSRWDSTYFNDSDFSPFVTADLLEHRDQSYYVFDNTTVRVDNDTKTEIKRYNIRSQSQGGNLDIDLMNSPAKTDFTENGMNFSDIGYITTSWIESLNEFFLPIIYFSYSQSFLNHLDSHCIELETTIRCIEVSNIIFRIEPIWSYKVLTGREFTNQPHKYQDMGTKQTVDPLILYVGYLNDTSHFDRPVYQNELRIPINLAFGILNWSISFDGS